jgi:dihydrodipicolinate synthase/N-acetylneuraminate lyase
MLMSEKRYPSTILGTVCIPWTAGYSLDREAFCRQVEILTGSRLDHLYLFGTAGEGYGVSDAQFDEIVTLFAEQMAGPGLHPMVGIVSLSFQTMLQRAARAYELGIRDFQFALPSWGALSDLEMHNFFHALCDPYPDCRFILYNLMRAKRLVSVGEFAVLAEEIPNLAGTKFTSADILTIHEMAESDLPVQFFLGEKNFGYGSRFGEFGYLISLGTSNLDRAWEYFHAGAAGDSGTLDTISRELYGMLKGFMDIMGRGRIDGAYDKVFSKTLDSSFPLRLLPPYESSTDEQYSRYCAFLREEYPQWLK